MVDEKPEIIFVEVSPNIMERIVKLTEGKNALYKTKSEFVREAIRDKLEKLGA